MSTKTKEPAKQGSKKQFAEKWDLKACRAQAPTKIPAPHQAEALGHLGKWFRGLGGAGGGILVLPTGGGKTFTASKFLCLGPLSEGYKVLWLAHTHHLLEQAYQSFDGQVLCDVREPRSTMQLRVVSGTPGHYSAAEITPDDDIVIITLQTATSAYRKELDQLFDFVDSADGKLFVVFDEAHHSPAPSYRKLIQHLQAEGAKVLGLTATPTYTQESKRGWLEELFPQGVIAQSRASDLIAARILARPRFEKAQTNVRPDFDGADYQKWLGTYGDLPESVIEKLASDKERNAFIARTYADNRERFGKTIIFTDRWFQCEAIAESLAKHGVKAGSVYSHVDATLPSVEARRKRTRDENHKVLDRFRAGELDVLINVRMLTEGTDVPKVESVFLTRQTTSRILLTQMVGRALRGPEFGGTEEANIVSFTDDWQQAIQWADYQLKGGDLDADEPKYDGHPPLQLISIDLVRRLANDLAQGLNSMTSSFVVLMPAGWYRTIFDTLDEARENVIPAQQLVMVFDDERAGLESLLQELDENDLESLAREDVSIAEARPFLEKLYDKHLSGSWRLRDELLFAVFAIVRHVAQGNGAPAFFEFAARSDHDLDALVTKVIEDDLGPMSELEFLKARYTREDRYWHALFPRFEIFHQYFDLCKRRQVYGPTTSAVEGSPLSAPREREPDQATKEQVKRRDGYACVCCGATRWLEVDHIEPFMRGGNNDSTNLQTLCKVCNRAKGDTRTIRFKSAITTVSGTISALPTFDPPKRSKAADPDAWERYLRQRINFAYQCGAVSSVVIGKRGGTYYNWKIELAGGLQPKLLAHVIEHLLADIQEVREAGGKPALESLTITAPNAEVLSWP